MAIKLTVIKVLSQVTPSKIVMVVLDGLGGLPDPATGKTELESAATPHLDALATRSLCGLTEPVSPGITPGSGPGHLALFGYDPLVFEVGRGILEATGIDFPLQQGDIAARGNFCTLDKTGMITDRRAGRIATEASTRLCRLIDGQMINGTQIFVIPVRDHRCVVIFRGPNLSASVSDSDPGKTGAPPEKICALTKEGQNLADIANRFLEEARSKLSEHTPANMLLLRGFSQRPDFPPMTEVYQLKPAAIAPYPMYRGLAKLVGMQTLPTGATIEAEVETLCQNYNQYDFFFLHVKGTDAAGEDGDFARKVKFIEQFDHTLPGITKLAPEVLIIAGDHSTPAILKGHSWHPVPFLLASPWCRPDGLKEFSESACRYGGLGRFPATQVMTLAMAHALKLAKYGA
jgi:2,3-bisphosphoglycerate-independent phosphoglycerate mutase